MLYWTFVEYEREVPKTTKPGPKANKSSVRVFIVEDEPTTIILTEAMLNQLGYQAVGVATSYETAMAALKTKAVDIVLVDLVLSGEKTGFDVIKELNALNIPCVLITGTINDVTLQKLADLDVYGFLPKPYDQLALATAIQLALKKYTRMQDKIFEEADAIKSRILATKALEEEFGVSEKLYLIRKEKSENAAKEFSGASYHLWIKVCVVLAVLIVGLAGVGFVFNIPFLLSYSSHGANMKINAMLCMFLLSFSIWIENEKRTAKVWKNLSLLSLFTVLCVGGITIVEYLLSVDLGIDESIFSDIHANEFNIAGRMAGTTALSFVFLSAALIANRLKKYRFSFYFTEGFALMSLFLSMVGILGHVFRQSEFNLVIPYLAQARPTLIVLSILTLSVFYLNPKQGLMSIFSNRRTSAKLGRKMLFWINAIMIVVSYSIYYFTSKSNYTNLEVIFILIVTITMLTTVILWSTLKQIKNEIQSEQTVKFVQNRERELQFVLKRVPNPVAVLDREMRYILVSRKWMDEFNLTEKNIIGRNHYEVFPNLPEQVKILNQRAMNGEIINLAVEDVTDNEGFKVDAKGEIRPWFDINNQVAGIIIFLESVTRRTISPAPDLNQ